MINSFNKLRSYFLLNSKLLNSKYLGIIVLIKLLKFKLFHNKKVIEERILIKALKGYPELIIRPLTSDLYFLDKIINCESYKLPLQINPEYILDCGAHIGLTSVYFAHSFPNAKIIAIEPEESNFELLTENTKSFSDRITLLKGAVWYKSSNNLLIMNPIDKSNTVGFCIDSEIKSNTNYFVKGYTINEIIDKYKIPNVDILKMDIEGSEMALFEKSDLNFLNVTKVIIIEIHNDSDRTKKRFISNKLNNYKLCFYCNLDDNYVFVRK